jgi:hemolysin III
MCIIKSAGNFSEVVASVIYGASMIALYTMSSVYHGLRPGMGKKVMQVIDHCTIYLLIAGSYTPVLVCAMAPRFQVIGWGLLAFVWALAILAATLTAIDLKAYKVFSMVCYIAMGWAIILFIPQLLQVLSGEGFRLLLAGGIAYTIGAILYGLGKKCPWMHSVFHVFVVLGSLLQFLCIYLHVL